jgi:hypothetical protein
VNASEGRSLPLGSDEVHQGLHGGLLHHEVIEVLVIEQAGHTLGLCL